MTDSKFSSALNTGLPNAPLVGDKELREQLQMIYNAIQTLQIGLQELRDEFDAYVLAHP